MSDEPASGGHPPSPSYGATGRPPLQSFTDERLAARLRGFGLLGIISMLIIFGGNMLFVPLSGILVLVWAWISQTPWGDLGLARPKSWARTIAVGIAFGVALKFAMKSIVMPLLGAPPVNAPFHFLAHNPAEIPWMLYVIFVGAGFGEETIFRGWAFERLGTLLGKSVWAKAFAVLFTSVWFAYEHYGLQGMPGVQNAFVVGLVFGTVFAVTGRIFLLMIAHVAFDLTALAMIYWNFETAVARFFFK